MHCVSFCSKRTAAHLYHCADDPANVDNVGTSSNISNWVLHVSVVQIQDFQANSQHVVLKLKPGTNEVLVFDRFC